MKFSRPDLSLLDPEVRAYIEALETEIENLKQDNRPSRLVQAENQLDELQEAIEPSEPPTTINVITATPSGIAKRTPRHLYSRQRRGGMGVFDINLPEDEPPALLTLADEAENLLVLTDQARVFRLPANAIPEAPVRGRGEKITSRVPLQPEENLAVILRDRAEGYVAVASQRGYVRLLRHHVFGEYMKPGTTLFDPKINGLLAAACWTPGDGALFIASRQGRAIRFSEKSLPPQGGPGIRLADDDWVIGITAVYPESGVLLITADGKGTIRMMEGFNPNKAPGAGGKVAMNTDELAGALTVNEGEDIFIVSELSKIIRFLADEIPPKEGVVQGVNCMSLRADKITAVAVSSLDLDK